MTVKEIIDKLSEYNSEAKINVVVDGFERPFAICFGCSEGVVKTNCETVDLMVGDIDDEAGEQKWNTGADLKKYGANMRGATDILQ